MKSYGQFCSIARALDLLGERWTLLIVRELLCGSRRFSEVQRGIPRISRTMLAARVRELGTWGQRWLARDLHASELDARPLIWDIHRRVRREALPDRPLVVCIELTDVRGAGRHHYLLLRRSEVSVCAVNPGFPEELHLRADRPTLVGWWR